MTRFQFPIDDGKPAKSISTAISKPIVAPPTTTTTTTTATATTATHAVACDEQRSAATASTAVGSRLQRFQIFFVLLFDDMCIAFCPFSFVAAVGANRLGAYARWHAKASVLFPHLPLSRDAVGSLPLLPRKVYRGGEPGVNEVIVVERRDERSLVLLQPHSQTFAVLADGFAAFRRCASLPFYSMPVPHQYCFGRDDSSGAESDDVAELVELPADLYDEPIVCTKEMELAVGGAVF